MQGVRSSRKPAAPVEAAEPRKRVAMIMRVGTSGVPAPLRARRWSEAVAAAYFPLDLRFHAPERFQGELALWGKGLCSLSRLTSDALAYSRLPHHMATEIDEHYLVSLPMRASVNFAQGGQSTRCPPGGFILERSHEPYEFAHAEPNDLLVLKVSGALLADRLRGPERFCALAFDASAGVGALFADMMRLVPQRLHEGPAELLDAVARQLVDLLALAIRSDARVLASARSSVREAHMIRIENYIRRHLAEPGLSPERVARACGVSTRYLHDLFRGTGRTAAERIREMRLRACRAALSDPHDVRTIAEIAYAWGFGDQAQFSRLFKGFFGLTPREARAESALTMGAGTGVREAAGRTLPPASAAS